MRLRAPTLRLRDSLTSGAVNMPRCQRCGPVRAQTAAGSQRRRRYALFGVGILRNLLFIFTPYRCSKMSHLFLRPNLYKRRPVDGCGLSSGRRKLADASHPPLNATPHAIETETLGAGVHK